MKNMIVPRWVSNWNFQLVDLSELRTRLETTKVFHWWTRENRRKIRTKGKTWWWWCHYWQCFGSWFHCGKNLPRIAGRVFHKYYCDNWCRRFDISRDPGFSNSRNRSLWQLTRQEYIFSWYYKLYNICSGSIRISNALVMRYGFSEIWPRGSAYALAGVSDPTIWLPHSREVLAVKSTVF